MEVPPETVARAVIRGIERNRSEVVYPWTMAASLVIYRLFPRFFQRGVERIYYRPIEDQIGLQPPDGSTRNP